MVQAVKHIPIVPLPAITRQPMAGNGTMEPQETCLPPKKGVIQTPFGAQIRGANSHYPKSENLKARVMGFRVMGTGLEEVEQPDTLDDRVECQHCSFFKQEMATQRYPADVWDKIVRVNHPANQWMFELAKVTGGWVTVTYPRAACYGGEPAPMPLGLKHRCDYFEPFNKVAIKEALKEWWES